MTLYLKWIKIEVLISGFDIFHQGIICFFRGGKVDPELNFFLSFSIFPTLSHCDIRQLGKHLRSLREERNESR